ncbi:hypothetical protein [Streptomyces sp. NPDC058620]|uniref:hypothetical protein n=1 Tax=Streptomyces sp. NPDC058620 TaxID=3346560 RepID=UPI00364E68E8
MRDGRKAGPALLDELAGEPHLRAYPPYVTARADLLHRLGRRTKPRRTRRRSACEHGA